MADPGASDYQQRAGELQQRLRESERKRLELERKLFEYSHSNRAISHLKYVKLANSWKEICEWEKKALRRNKEILEDFKHIETHAMTLKTSTDKLQQMRSEYEKYLKKVLPVWKKTAQTTSDSREYRGQMLQVGKEAGINMNLSRGSHHPTTIFMSRQMSANSSIEHFSTQHKSLQPTKSFSIYDPNSCRQAAKSSNMTDSYVIQTNSDIHCLNKSDKIDGKTYLQISKKASLASSVSSEHGQTCSADIESVRSNRSHSVEDEQSAKLKCQLHERLSPENRAKDLKYYSPSSKVEKVEEASVHKNPVINDERFELCRPSEFLPGVLDSFSEQSSDKHEAWEGKNQGVEGVLHIKSTNEQDNESLDSSSDLTISVSETDDIITSAKPPMDMQHLNRSPEFGRPVNTQQEEEVGSSIITPCILNAGPALEIQPVCLSEEGFSHLLQSVEEMILQASTEGLELYQSRTLSETKLKELVSLCNQRMTLKVEDLEACAAIVLQQFQMLLQSTRNRPLLPEKMLGDNISSTDEKTKRFSSLLDSLSFRERLYKHALFLKDHHLLHRTNMAEMLTSLLAAGKEEKSTETLSLLKKVLTEESEEVSSFHSRGSSCSLLAMLNDNSEVKQAKPSEFLDSNRASEQDVTDWHEDERQEESLLGKIPITGKETKVGKSIFVAKELNQEEISSDVSELEQPDTTPLQVPKTMVQNRKTLVKEKTQTETTSAASVLEHPPGLISGTHNVKSRTRSKISSEASVSSSEKSPISRHEKKNKVLDHTKSKAFWGESDDTTSDIEDVLRPQNQDADDFDDFYD